MLEARVRSIFEKARFVEELGIKLIKVSEGSVETELAIRDSFRQQHGFIHAGVIATLGDHTAGGAARTLTGEKDVITIEFKINFLRPAKGNKLTCAGKVLHGGKQIATAEAEIFDEDGKLVAKLTETLSVIDARG
jgi:uncharacterized protein (TIGR00369 family)